MDFRLSDEQIEWRDLCHRFAVEVMRPVAADYDRSQEVPWDVIREARKWKLSGIDWIQKMATDSDGLNGIIYQGTRIERLALTNGDQIYLAPKVVLHYQTRE